MVPSSELSPSVDSRPRSDHSAGRLAPWRPLPNLPSHEVESRWMRRTQQLGLLVRSIPGSNSRFSSATDELDRRSREPGRWGWGWGSSALFPGWRASELALVRLGQVRKGKGTGVFPFRKPATWHDRGAPIGLLLRSSLGRFGELQLTMLPKARRLLSLSLASLHLNSSSLALISTVRHFETSLTPTVEVVVCPTGLAGSREGSESGSVCRDAASHWRLFRSGNLRSADGERGAIRHLQTGH